VCTHLPISPFVPSYHVLYQTAPTGTYSLTLHDALPIFLITGHDLRLDPQDGTNPGDELRAVRRITRRAGGDHTDPLRPQVVDDLDRKSTRLNSSHVKISYAVFCLKKKN